MLNDIVAIVDYSFGNYKFYATQIATIATPSPLTPTPSLPLPPTPGVTVTIGSLNVENLSPADPPSKFARIADAVVKGLRSPDILGVAEVQDNNGPTDTGVVAADVTLGLLISAIQAAGGPTYVYLQINPVNNLDGGQPGGNIRQVCVYVCVCACVCGPAGPRVAHAAGRLTDRRAQTPALASTAIHVGSSRLLPPDHHHGHHHLSTGAALQPGRCDSRQPACWRLH